MVMMMLMIVIMLSMIVMIGRLKYYYWEIRWMVLLFVLMDGWREEKVEADALINVGGVYRKYILKKLSVTFWTGLFDFLNERFFPV